MSSFASVNDIITLWRPLTADEAARAEALLPVVSDLIRQAAADVGKDFDAMVEASPTLANTAKLVTVDVVARILRQNTTGELLTQESQTALGYNWQGTYAIPGGGMANALMRNDLKRLGIARAKQQIRGIELYDSGNIRSAAEENTARP